jgi:membrane protein CcdC involved in cytochrome C biogenesis
MTQEIAKQGDIKSRKFCVTLLGLVVILIVATVSALKSIDGEAISGIVVAIAGVVGAYVIGQGYADGQAVKK